MSNLHLAWRLARRELRGSRRGLAIFLACLILGVGAIAGVGSLQAALTAGLAKEGSAILGGDVEVRLNHRRASPKELAWLQTQGQLSVMVDMRTMAGNGGDTARRMLVQLSAIDNVYPLYGAVQTTAGTDIPALVSKVDGQWGALLEPAAMDRLGLAIGDDVQIGSVSYTLRGAITDAPDRLAIGLTFGPRVMVSEASIADTGLIQPGSLVHYIYRLALSPEISLRSWATEVRTLFPDAGWRIRDRRNGVPGVRRFVDRLAMFLTLAGLTALIVGGVGVGNGVRDYLAGKTNTIATLKCLGAPSQLIFWTYLIQVLVFTFASIVLGLGIGLLIPLLVKLVAGALLPIPIAMGVYGWPLALAGLYGLLVSLVFALWPVIRARDVPGARLFRSLATPVRRWPRWQDLAAIGALALALIATMIWTSDDRVLAVWFLGGVLIAFVGLRLTALGITYLARWAGRLSLPPIFRLALANLHRPGAATPAVVLSLGLGLSLLSAVNLINSNLSAQISDRLPAQAPAYFFVDIVPDQAEAFERDLRELPGVSRIERTPMLRGRIMRVKGIPSEKVAVAPASQWMLHGDRGLTYSEWPPEGADIVAGEWWPADYDGPPQVSFDAQGAADMGMTLGDEVTINVLGREITAVITSLRAINWGTLGLNFIMVFSPNTLAAAPHMQLATLYADDSALRAIDQLTATKYPAVSAVRVKDAIERAAAMMGTIAGAIQAIGSITIFAGLLVLIGAIASGQQARMYDSAVLKVLGFTRWRVLAIHSIEYALLGIFTAIIASLFGAIGAWAVIDPLMGLRFTLFPEVLIYTIAITAIVTLMFGLLGTARSLNHKPARLLNS